MNLVSATREEKLNRLKESFQKGDLHSCIDEAIKLIKKNISQPKWVGKLWQRPSKDII